MGVSQDQRQSPLVEPWTFGVGSVSRSTLCLCRVTCGRWDAELGLEITVGDPIDPQGDRPHQQLGFGILADRK
jgi:hypothetical protein